MLIFIAKVSATLKVGGKCIKPICEYRLGNNHLLKCSNAAILSYENEFFRKISILMQQASLEKKKKKIRNELRLRLKLYIKVTDSHISTAIYHLQRKTCGNKMFVMMYHLSNIFRSTF